MTATRHSTTRRLLSSIALLVGLVTPATAQTQTDAIPFATVQIVGGAPDVHAWPVTTAITSVSFTPDNVFVRFTKDDGPGRWPDITPPGWDGPIEFTLWAVVQSGGQWVTTGCIEFWYGRQWTGVGGPFSKAAGDWYYFAPEMASIQPHAGEMVGFFVTAGDARRKDVHAITERSAVVLLAVPPADTGDFDFAIGSTPPPLPPPPPPPDDPTIVTRLTAAELAIKTAEGKLQFLSDAVDALALRVQHLEARPIFASCSASLNLGASRIPISCKLTQ